MRLVAISDIVVENVERLIPHLRDDINKYLEKRKEADLLTPNTAPTDFPHWRASTQQIEKWVDTALEWGLRSDPKYIKEQRRGKDLNRIKAPFVRYILKWWLDPDSGGGINLPEDIETVAETLTQFNNAKQHGLNASVGDFQSWGSLVNALTPYLSQEEADSDSYGRMGLDLVFSSGPWKMYLVDKWIPGDASTLYPGQVCHRAFEGTRWCVKYQSTFENTYSGVYYLVLYRGKRFALINFPSKQFKDPQDRRIESTDDTWEKGAQFLKLLFSERPDFLAELALALLDGGWSNDFKNYEKLFAKEIKQILKTPAAKKGALRDPINVESLARRIGEWPRFETWPEGYQKIISTNIGTKGRSTEALHHLVRDTGRIPETEEQIITRRDLPGFKKYCKWLTEYDLDKKNANELAQMGRKLVISYLDFNMDQIRNSLGWLSIEKSLGTLAPWPEFEQYILNSKDPRAAYSYAKLKGEEWPEAESLIATDERAKKAYEKLVGREITVPGETPVEPTDPKSIVKKCVYTSKEATEEQEHIILQDIDAAIDYAQYIIGPWPELEDKLRQAGTRQQIKKYEDKVLYYEFQ